MKKIMFTLLFIAGEMKCNFVSRVVGVKRPIEKCKPERNLGIGILGAIMQAYIEEV